MPMSNEERKAAREVERVLIPEEDVVTESYLVLDDNIILHCIRRDRTVALLLPGNPE